MGRAKTRKIRTQACRLAGRLGKDILHELNRCHRSYPFTLSFLRVADGIHTICSQGMKINIIGIDHGIHPGQTVISTFTASQDSYRDLVDIPTLGGLDPGDLLPGNCGPFSMKLERFQFIPFEQVLNLQELSEQCDKNIALAFGMPLSILQPNGPETITGEFINSEEQ